MARIAINICKIILIISLSLRALIVDAQEKAVNAFYYASEIVIDSKGNVFVSGKNNKIIKITPDGAAYHFAGHPKGNSQHRDGKASDAMFYNVKGLAIDSKDHIYVADYNTVRKVTPDGSVTTLYGNSNKGLVKDGNRNSATFYRLGPITIDNHGTLYVTDTVFDSLRKRTVNIIRKISPDGQVRTIKNPDGTMLKINSIEGLSCDVAGNLYVSAVAWSSALLKISPDEKITTIAGAYDESAKNRAQFKEDAPRPISPVGIAINQKGEVFFSDRCLNRILKVVNNRVVSVTGSGGRSSNGANLLGGCGSGGSVDGNANEALLNGPAGIAFDRTGNLYIVDGGSSNSYIRKYSPDGLVTTFCRHDYNPITKQYEESINDERKKIVHAQPVKSETKTGIFNADLTKQINDHALNAKRLIDSLTNSPTQATKQQARKVPTLPTIDTARISTISNKNLTIAEVNAYLRSLQSQLVKLLPRAAVTSSEAIAKKAQNEPKKLHAAAVIAWQKGAWEEALLLSTNAAANSGDLEILTNTAAILDMTGLSEKAVPVLRTILRIDPESALAHNNMGQAYAALGMKDSALLYFSRCLNLSPEHPEANNTAGHIELEKGNESKAVAHFENSIRGGFNHHAYNGLLSIKRDYKITKLIKPKVKIPEYFNDFKYQLPRQCTNTEIAEEVKKEHAEFNKTIGRLKDKYEKLSKEYENRFASEGVERLKMNAKQGKKLLKPFLTLGYVMVVETTTDYAEELAVLAKFDKEHKRQYDQLEKEYQEQIREVQKKFDRDCCWGEGYATCCPEYAEVCKAITEVKNTYLPKFAQLMEEKQSRHLLVEKKYFDDLIYWNYISAFDSDDFKRRFYGIVSNHLKVLSSLATTKILEGCYKKELQETKEKEDTSAVKIPGCPFSLSVRLWILKFDGDCEKISVKAGEGIVFRYERNFMLRQSTVSFGIGADIDQARGKEMNIEYGIEAEATMALFLTYDQGGNFTDGGMIYKLKGKASAGFESGQKLNFKEGISWQFGINSGIAFEPGPLVKLLEPTQEIQRSKNVKIYSPN